MENEVLLNQAPVTFEEKEDNSGSFTVVIQFLRRFIILIVACTLIGAGIGLALATVKDKTVYTQTKSVMFIAKIDNKTMATNISLTNKYLPTIREMIVTPIFISKANEVYKNDYKSRSGSIGAGGVGIADGGGMILSISYSDYDPAVASDKLSAFIKAVGEELKGRLTADEVDVVSIDNVPSTSSSNGFAKFVLLGVLGGLVIGIAVAFLFYLFDNTVSSKAELERLTGATVVAYIDDVLVK